MRWARNLSRDDDANGETLSDKKKATAQNDEQPTDECRRRLIARKPAKNHHQTDGQMNKWETSEQRGKPANDIVKYREQLKMLFLLSGHTTRLDNETTGLLNVSARPRGRAGARRGCH